MKSFSSYEQSREISRKSFLSLLVVSVLIKKSTALRYVVVCVCVCLLNLSCTVLSETQETSYDKRHVERLLLCVEQCSEQIFPHRLVIIHVIWTQN